MSKLRWKPILRAVYRDELVDVEVSGGVANFTWAISGAGFSLTYSGEISSRTNSVRVSESAGKGDEAIITVTDANNDQVQGKIRCCIETGRIWGCGRNQYSELGLGAAGTKQTLTPLGGHDNWDVLAGAGESFMGLRDGVAFGCGLNVYGELGVGDKTQRYFFTLESSGCTTWKTIVGGHNCFVGIKEDGTLWAVGDGAKGQLGSGGETDKLVFNQESLEAANWASVASGGWHTAAIRDNGTLWVTGYNNYGQLGLNDKTDRYTFTQVGALTTWAKVQCGWAHTMCLKTDGTLWGAGGNSEGALGLGATSEALTLTQVGVASDWEDLWADEYRTYVVNSSGQVYATGGNTLGNLGVGDGNKRTTLTLLPEVTYCKSVAFMSRNTIMVCADGHAYGTGYNGYYELGFGETTQRLVFTKMIPYDIGWEAAATCNWTTILLRIREEE